MKTNIILSMITAGLTTIVSSGVACADHIEKIDDLTFKAQRQTLNYVRGIRSSARNHPAMLVLKQDALGIFTGMSELQKTTFFFADTHRERRNLHRQVNALASRVHSAEENVENIITNLEHRYILQHSRFENRLPKGGIQVKVAKGIQVQFGKYHKRPRHGWNPHQQTISQLRRMKRELESLHETLEALDELFH